MYIAEKAKEVSLKRANEKIRDKPFSEARIICLVIDRLTGRREGRIGGRMDSLWIEDQCGGRHRGLASIVDRHLISFPVKNQRRELEGFRVGWSRQVGVAVEFFFFELGLAARCTGR